MEMTPCDTDRSIVSCASASLLCPSGWVRVPTRVGAHCALLFLRRGDMLQQAGTQLGNRRWHAAIVTFTGWRAAVARAELAFCSDSSRLRFGVSAATMPTRRGRIIRGSKLAHVAGTIAFITAGTSSHLRGMAFVAHGQVVATTANGVGCGACGCASVHRGGGCCIRIAGGGRAVFVASVIINVAS